MRILVLFIVLAAFATGCKDFEHNPSKKDYAGIVLTEVAANGEKPAVDSWVEIHNTTSRNIPLSGLGLYLIDKDSKAEEITIMDDMILMAGRRTVFSTADMTLIKGIPSDEDFELVLGMSADKNIVDRFSRSKDGQGKPTSKYGSYQRIPEDGDEWKVTSQATRRIRNFDAKPNGIWLWSTHMDRWIANDFAVLKQMKQLGYDHILLNYNAFDNPAQNDMARQLIAMAKEEGMKVHAWMQVFCENKKWINPIENLGSRQGRYKQEEFDRIIAKAHRYIDDFDVDGIHLDYIRFSGSGANLANVNNYDNGVTASGAINEFCRQLRESLDARPEGVIVSAAMMTLGDILYYYGQDPVEMGKYIDIFIPMAYKYFQSHSYDDSWLRSICATFTQASKAQVWAGIQTYSYPADATGEVGMTPEQVLADAEVIRSTDCSGLVLFRYALGSYPDLNTLWDDAQ